MKLVLIKSQNPNKQTKTETGNKKDCASGMGFSLNKKIGYRNMGCVLYSSPSKASKFLRFPKTAENEEGK